MSTLVAISIDVTSSYLIKSPGNLTKLIIEILAWGF
jgi:hypothetical protein